MGGGSTRHVVGKTGGEDIMIKETEIHMCITLDWLC